MKTLIKLTAVTVTLVATATATYAKDIQKAVLAGGCFWCIESDFEQLNGVISVQSGFTGGKTENPTYKQVTSGGTGHFEAVEITFDADIISYDRILNRYWRSIDATDAGGQFCDRGQSYKTAIFAKEGAQTKIANTSKTELIASNKLSKVVTPIKPLSAFYPAEEYHQDYYKKTKTVITRFGPISKATAYKKYRKGCGRDARVKALWGDEAWAAH